MHHTAYIKLGAVFFAGFFFLFQKSQFEFPTVAAALLVLLAFIDAGVKTATPQISAWIRSLGGSTVWPFYVAVIGVLAFGVHEQKRRNEVSAPRSIRPTLPPRPTSPQIPSSTVPRPIIPPGPRPPVQQGQTSGTPTSPTPIPANRGAGTQANPPAPPLPSPRPVSTQPVSSARPQTAIPPSANSVQQPSPSAPTTTPPPASPQPK